MIRSFKNPFLLIDLEVVLDADSSVFRLDLDLFVYFFGFSIDFAFFITYGFKTYGFKFLFSTLLNYYSFY